MSSAHLNGLSYKVHKLETKRSSPQKNLEWTLPPWWFIDRHPLCIHCTPQSYLLLFPHLSWGSLMTTTPLFSGRGSVGSVSGSRLAGLKLTEQDMLLVLNKWLIIWALYTHLCCPRGGPIHHAMQDPNCDLTDMGQGILLSSSSPGDSVSPSGVSFIFCSLFSYTVIVILNFLSNFQ